VEVLKNARSRRVECSWKKQKSKGCFFFFGTDLKKVQRQVTENPNYHVSSGKLPLVRGVFVLRFLSDLGKKFTWIFQESVEMNFQIHNAWKVLGALCGWIKRKSGAEILLFIWR